MAGSGLGYEILGAVKVKDGLFIGDELAAQDLEFIVSNKVTRVINTCGRQVPNHWESIGVVYLTYYWVDVDSQVILDQRDVVANEVFRFAEEALVGAESVLIHSVRGQSRSCCILSAYMMKKYSWGLRKTMEFLSFRRPDMNLKPGFLQQLSAYERRLTSQSKLPFSFDWHDVDFSRMESEDLLLRNTYINSQMGPLAEFKANDNATRSQPRKLVWQDPLEKPAGADHPNVPKKGVLKKPVAAAPDPHNVSNKDLLEKPTLADHHQNHQQSAPNIETTQQQQPGPWPQNAPVEEGNPRMRSGTPPVKVIPTAWAPENDGPARANHSSALVLQNQAQTFARKPAPAMNIRDSLVTSTQRTSSRDPSPKASLDRRPAPRGDSPLRNDSPLRYPSRRNSSPATNANPPGTDCTGSRGPLIAAPVPGWPAQPPARGGGGGVRSTARSTQHGPDAWQQQQQATGRGMGAFRSGGPVKAKADLLGDGNSSIRRPRPQTAPLMGAAQRSSSQQRPASPQHMRASTSSPGPQVAMTAPAPRAPMVGPQQQRNLSAHMRRAPSPTPAFNRNPSPSKPRWRS